MIKKDVIFEYDTVQRKCKIQTDYLNEIREHFSVEDEAMVFVRKRLGRNLPVRKYAITNKGHFDAPFFEEIYKYITKEFPCLIVKTDQTFIQAYSSLKLDVVPLPLKVEPRDYQIDSATAALQKGRGIIVLPTSAGKTLTIALIANTYVQLNSSNVLILVPNIQLVQQTYQDFLDYGINETSVSRWTGNHEFQQTNIVIANSQILLSEKQDTSVLQRFSHIIVDECHKLATSEKITKLVKKTNCKNLIGFTGSLPEAQFDVWSLNRIFGSVLFYKKSIELRQDNYISNVRVVALEMQYNNIPKFTKPSVTDPTSGYEEETNWLHINEFRNSTISKLINKLETNTLIMVDRITHGEHLKEYLTLRTDKKIFFIQGSIEVEEREQIRQIMEKENGVVCIAISKIFSTGISIKNLHNVVFAAMGKARIKIIQTIGRSLRLHHTKHIATIFDIADTCLTYGNKHFNERKRIYMSENIPLIAKTIVES
jgi:superfamily II DNA or RNA helicase